MNYKYYSQWFSSMTTLASFLNERSIPKEHIISIIYDSDDNNYYLLYIA